MTEVDCVLKVPLLEICGSYPFSNINTTIVIRLSRWGGIQVYFKVSVQFILKSQGKIYHFIIFVFKVNEDLYSSNRGSFLYCKQFHIIEFDISLWWNISTNTYIPVLIVSAIFEVRQRFLRNNYIENHGIKYLQKYFLLSKCWRNKLNIRRDWI